ncbi:uncharacterized protein LOC135615838 isoform X2 [Musa acuminata AAA Group]|uniref:uncharacterized protein LOC135615838 isoform X2 n=1 Tax=Musa acuminata AAA Group TaxID=214697 RepID=UPI0031DE8F82
MLMCLQELLKKCHFGSVNQMVVVLKKIVTGAMLSHSEASEEFREGIIRCFRAMLLNLQPCSVSSCSCKQMVIMPTSKSIDGAIVHHNTLSRNCVESLECLLAFLQAQNASAAVGHWLSLLLQAAELEALRGHRGSANLRKEAILTFRVLAHVVYLIMKFSQALEAQVLLPWDPFLRQRTLLLYKRRSIYWWTILCVHQS